jgi:hypothetical protein
MGCGCGGGAKRSTVWTVTAPAGNTFPDGERTKNYTTEREADAAVASMPGSSKERTLQ